MCVYIYYICEKNIVYIYLLIFFTNIINTYTYTHLYIFIYIYHVANIKLKDDHRFKRPNDVLCKRPFHSDQIVKSTYFDLNFYFITQL